MNKLIVWYTNNSVAANVLMTFILIMGVLSIPETRKELIPNVSLERISIYVSYPGATPEEVEQAVCQRIETAVGDVEGMVDLETKAREGNCTIELKVGSDYDIQTLLDDIKSRVDNLHGLPPDAHKPIIKELRARNRVATLIISGEAEEWVLKNLAGRIREDLLDHPDISVVDLDNVRPYEVSVQVAESSLRQYDLSLSEIANIIENSSQNLPGGVLNTTGGDVLLQTQGKLSTATEYESLILRAKPDGGRLLLGDMANIVEGFEHGDSSARFNAKPAVSLEVYRIGNQSIVEVVNVVKDYVQNPRIAIPQGVALYLWQDDSKRFQGWVDLLGINALQGLALLFVMLMMFLHWRISFWVTLGIPVTFMGAFWFLPLLGGSINAVSLFAFILVLGIVVDDAIMVGESVFRQRSMGMGGVDSAIAGTQQIAKPIFFAILTTIIAFSPLLYLPGPEGQLVQVIPLVVISTLLFSLIDSLFILPAHLAHSYTTTPGPDNTRGELKGLRCQQIFTRAMEFVVDRLYRPFLRFALAWRLSVLAIFIVVFAITVMLLSGGWLKVVLFTDIEADFASATVGFAEGTPSRITKSAVEQIEEAAQSLAEELREEVGTDQIKNIFSVVAPRQKKSNAHSDDRGHIGVVSIEYVDSKERKIPGKEVVRRWWRKIGDIPNATQLRIESNSNNPQPDLSINFFSEDLATLKELSEAVKQQLIQYDGVYEIRDSLQSGREQAMIRLKPVARNLGLTQKDLGAQVRQAFHGIEVQSLYRGEDEVKVMVRYPDEAFYSLWHLENMYVRLPDGSKTPLLHVADIEDGAVASTIKRIDRKRAATVTAYVDGNQTSPTKVMQRLKSDVLNQLAETTPNASWKLTGRQKSINEFFGGLFKSYIFALVSMYLLIAVLFRSYSQPLMVMYAIPFGIIGSLVGHWITGVDITLWSFVGMVAVSGVVVNDNLVLVDYINENRRAGKSLIEAISNAGAERFRPIVLTSVTTFVGLMPLILETSVQAQFLIPMAVSLSFGVLFATLISLVLVPATYLTLQNINTAVEARIVCLRLLLSFKRESQVTLDEAYRRGYHQGVQGRDQRSPYKNEVLVASWEAGWNDALHS